MINKKPKNITISTKFARNSKFTMKEKGLYLYLCTIDRNELFSIEETARYFKDGVTSINTALKGLENKNYIFREIVREPNDGRFLGSIIHIMQ